MYRWMMCILLVLTLLVSAGCKDVSDRYRPASFGRTADEKAMVEALSEKYGDLTQSGEPRFLEARMTTAVNNSIPVDTVSSYTQETSELYVWFVYDNFNKDEIEVEWIYLKDNYTIHTFKATTGEDFGRGTFVLEEPTDGWPLGNYKVIIRGRGVETSVTFSIITGPTVATPLKNQEGQIALATKPGWYFTSWEYVISSSDVTVVEGGRIQSRLAGSTGPGGILYDYYESSGDKNDFSHSHTRTNIDGKVIARGAGNIKWTDPALYVEPGIKAAINMTIAVESSWGMGNVNVSFDMADIRPGYATAGKINFGTPDGRTFLSDSYSGSLESTRVIPQGKPGDKRSIIVTLGNGYGFIYIYEWRE